MSITLTQVGDQFELVVVNSVLPALTLTAETTREFAKALLSEEARTPAWETDKHVWSPTDRNISLGIWMSPAGQLSIYVTGENVDLADDDRQALAEQVLLTVTEFPAGTEVQPKDRIYVTTEADGTPAGSRGFAQDAVGTISRVYLDHQGRVCHEITWPDGSFSAAYSDVFRQADPIQDWIVTEGGRLYPYREATVKARTRTQAEELARPLLNKAKWQGVAARAIEPDYDNGLESMLVSSMDDMTDVAIDPGTGTITVGLDKVMSQALAGDARAIMVLKGHLGL